MTACAGRERELALHVAGDLAPDEAARLEAHLATCPACRESMRRLAHSQEALRALAVEPVAEEALTRVRARVRERLRGSRRVEWAWGPRWMAAATVGAAVIAATAVVRVALRPEPQQPVATRTSPSVAPPAAAREREPIVLSLAAPASPSRFSGARRAVPAAAVPSRPAAAAEAAAPTLSPEDAEQLARALVYVAQLDGLPRVEENAHDKPSVPPPQLARFETDDPNVVIYWLLDSKGGSS